MKSVDFFNLTPSFLQTFHVRSIFILNQVSPWIENSEKKKDPPPFCIRQFIVASRKQVYEISEMIDILIELG